MSNSNIVFNHVRLFNFSLSNLTFWSVKYLQSTSILVTPKLNSMKVAYKNFLLVNIGNIKHKVENDFERVCRIRQIKNKKTPRCRPSHSGYKV